jgi:hypothetical protein
MFVAIPRVVVNYNSMQCCRDDRMLEAPVFNHANAKGQSKVTRWSILMYSVAYRYS